MTIDMTQFHQVFFEESTEHLEAMESLLLSLDLENPDAEDLNAIFRAAHSIKGSSGTFGFTDLAETTHILEDLLDRIRKHELDMRPDMVDAFLESSDLLRAMLEAHQGRGAAVDVSVAKTLCQRLRNLSDDAATVALTETLHSVGASSANNHVDVTASAAVRTFKIEFVPTQASAQGEGLQNFLAELGASGVMTIEAQPAEPHGLGFWQIRLVTDREESCFSEQLDFIADSGAWRIAEERSTDAKAYSAFGLFEEAPSAPEEDSAYGFFEPLSAVATKPALVLEEDDGYGFFEPLPASVPTAIEEGEGYGFFTPLPPVASSPIEAVAVPLAITPSSGERDGRIKTNKVPGGGDSSIRVSVEKVDQLINLLGELVITQAMLLQTAVQMQESAPERLLTGLGQLERNTRDLQESVMSIRMLPISSVFSRFSRVVRDLSGKLGKRVELKTSGENTELDKSLIERISDPLTHLIRNSLDHGVELPEKRVAAGKNPQGIITLKAYHQGGNIVIEVGDDGAGLNRQKILAKARERGFQISDQASDQEVFSLIFEAGFSTAEQVTDVSGRGVGMDVVRRNIQAMGGRVEIESMLGIGTRMTVRLPLTLAILDGMSVAVGDQIYILPLLAVIESMQPRADDVKTLSNQGRVILVRGEYLPVVVLHEVFGLPSEVREFTQGIMVVLDADGLKAALFVDALVGQHQVVIKSLEANYRRVPGISGATIMGDGHVAMILDVSAIASIARSSTHKAA